MTRAILIPVKLAVALALFALALASCGGDGGKGEAARDGGVPGNARPAEVRVIDAWSTALRNGHVGRAASYFALPSVAENGLAFVRITSDADARRFNRSLPCGAVLERAASHGEFTTATFRLTERPGAGACGAGTGERAKTAFVIEDGRILEWRRVPFGRQEPEGDVI